MSATDKLDKVLSDLRDVIAEVVEERYQQGFKDGANSMRESILRVAALPDVTKRATNIADIPRLKPLGVFDVEDEAQPRAPRGLVGKVVRDVLMAEQGLSIIELEARVVEADDRIAPKSVGNELRRFEGKRYRRGSDGRSWYLLGPLTEEKEAAGAATNDSPAAPDFLK